MPSRHQLVGALGAAALFLFAACGENPAAPENLSVTTQFTGFSAVQVASDVSSPSAGAAAGTIKVEGTFALPGPCYTMSARVESSSQFTVLYVIAERQPAGCATNVGQVSYSAVISGAAPGPHTVVVRHETDDARTNSSVDVATQTVVVR